MVLAAAGAAVAPAIARPITAAAAPGFRMFVSIMAVLLLVKARPVPRAVVDSDPRESRILSSARHHESNEREGAGFRHAPCQSCEEAATCGRRHKDERSHQFICSRMNSFVEWRAAG